MLAEFLLRRCFTSIREGPLPISDAEITASLRLIGSDVGNGYMLDEILLQMGKVNLSNEDDGQEHPAHRQVRDAYFWLAMK